MAIKPKGRATCRSVPPLARSASVAPGSLNEERRTVNVIWTTGARVLRGLGFSGGDYLEELSLEPDHVRMDRLRSGAPLLDNHNGGALGAVLGVVESARLEGDHGVATVRFARAEDDPAADVVFRKVRDGIIRNVSVGYRVHRMLEVKGDEVGSTPIYRAVDWEPYEISMVPMGADAGAGVRAEGAETNPCEFVAGGQQERSTMAKKTTAKPTTQATSLRAEPNPPGENPDGDEDETQEGEVPQPPAQPGEHHEQPAPATGRDDGIARGASVELAIRAERKRLQDLQRVAAQLNTKPEVVQRHVEAGTSPDRFREIALALFERDGVHTFGAPANITAGEDARDKFIRGAGDWLLQKSSLGSRVVEAAKVRGETPPKIDPGEFRGMRLLDLARHSLERNGVSTRGMLPMELVGKAFTYRSGGGYHSTSDFATLLEGTISRVLLANYATAPDTWRQFAAVGTVADFRPHSRIRVGVFGRLDKVNEHGEFKNKKLTDGVAEEIQAETIGNIVGITRQMIVNDDLGAFTSLSARLGRAAKLSIELMVYDLLAENGGLGPIMADGLTLFHADHGNISAGAALSVEGLGADMVKMAQQVDQEGNEFLDIRPARLLLPFTQLLAARGMLAAEFDVDAGDGTTPNPIRDMFVAENIIGSMRIAGTRRYMFADPNDVPTLEVVFLDGQQEPYLAQQEGWRIDGTEWKVRLDVGAGAVDWRGAVTNAGTP